MQKHSNIRNIFRALKGLTGVLERWRDVECEVGAILIICRLKFPIAKLLNPELIRCECWLTRPTIIPDGVNILSVALPNFIFF
jgi:hypothetical protein